MSDCFKTTLARENFCLAVLNPPILGRGELAFLSRSYRFLEYFGPSDWENDAYQLSYFNSHTYDRNAFVLTKSGLSGWSEFADLKLARENFCLAVPANHTHLEDTDMLLICRRDHRLKTPILHFFPNIDICQEEVQLLSVNMFTPTVPASNGLPERNPPSLQRRH